MIELKISAETAQEMGALIRGLAGAITPVAAEGPSALDVIREGFNKTATGAGAAPAAGETAPADDMRPVRGENAKALAAQIVAGALPTTHIARLPKALQDEVHAALTKREPTVSEAPAEEPELPLIRTQPENREPPVEAVVVPDPAPRKPWEKDVYAIEDVRAALMAYAEKFGMPAAMENGPTMIKAPKVSDLKPEQFGPAVAAIMAEIEAA